MESNIIIRKVTECDLDELIKLFESTWPDVQYNKSNKTQFVVLESSGINYCAEREDEIIGSRLSIPLNFMWGSVPLICIQVCDTCVRADYRRRGLMSKMNSELVKDFFGLEVANKIIWNVGVYESRQANEKMGWQYMDCFHSLIKIVRPFHIFNKIGLRINELSGDILWECNDDTIDIKDSFLEIREKLMQKSGLLHVNYTREYISWRTKYKSGMRVFHDDNLGDIVYKIGYKSQLVYVLIGEVFLSSYDKSTFRKLINKFEKLIHPDIIKVALSLSHPLYQAFRNDMFVKVHNLNLGVKIFDQAMVDYCLDPNLWAISMLDIDTF